MNLFMADVAGDNLQGASFGLAHEPTRRDAPNPVGKMAACQTAVPQTAVQHNVALHPASFQQRLPHFCSGPSSRQYQFQAFEPAKSAPEPHQGIPLQWRSTSPHPGSKSPNQPLRGDGKAKGIHPPQEQALLVAYGGKLFRQICNAPLKCRPVWPLMNIAHNLRTYCGEYRPQTPHFSRGASDVCGIHDDLDVTFVVFLHGNPQHT